MTSNNSTVLVVASTTDNAEAASTATKASASDVAEEGTTIEQCDSRDSNQNSVTNNDDSNQQFIQRKRARSAYFLFTNERRPQVQQENPGASVAAIAKIMGQQWSSLSTEEKSKYQEMAVTEREQVALYNKENDIINTNNNNNSNNVDNDNKRHDLGLPIAKVRKICKLDPEVKSVNKEALWLIAKAAELATIKLGLETVKVSQIQNRRKLLPDDVAQVCASREMFTFLRQDIQDLTRQQKEEQATATKKNNTAVAVESPAREGANKITEYFTAKG